MTNREKLIKDNVHEYIYIDEKYFRIIDTAVFQRLKNIKQTSYVSLYPSSTHDRFTHSLGTYYLGKQVIREIWKNIDGVFDSIFSSDKRDEESITKIGITFTFEISCLLHDVGHAPFSHTGEIFYKIKKIDDSLKNYDYYIKYKEEHKLDKFCFLDGLLIDELCNFYGVESGKISEHKIVSAFMRDYVKVLRDDTAKPHEKMSALISLKELKNQIMVVAAEVGEENGLEGKDIFDADLFVRCIIGNVYGTTLKDNTKAQIMSFKNAIISLLNSQVIDVDKLDYILRDNYMTGYKNISIDTERLIKSFTIFLEDNKWCRLAYKKNALSVIENVILANDSSRRWVQNHPIILYDTYITQRCVSETFRILQSSGENNDKIFEKFFSVDALTEKGVVWSGEDKIFLASDIDVIMLFKKAYTITREKNIEDAKSIFEEYFSRESRRHPLWKSEAEFKVCFNEKLMNEDERERMGIIVDAVVAIDSCKNKTTSVSECVINESLWEKINNKTIEFPQKGKELIAIIKTYFDKIGKDLDLVILYTNGYQSRRGKLLNKKSVYVEMPDYAINRWNHTRLYSYSELFEIDDTSQNNNRKMFFMYSKHRIDVKEFSTYLLTEANFE